jgi:hypothetical protein
MTVPTATQLRPLGVGERIDAAIKLFTKSFTVLAPALLAVALPLAIVDGLLSAYSAVTLHAHPFLTRNVDTGALTFHSANLQRALGAFFLVYVVSFVLLVVGKAITYRTFADVYFGRSPTWTGVLQGGLRRLGSLLWIDLLITAVSLSAVVSYAVVVVALVPLHSLAAVLLLAPSALLIVFLFWWATSCRLIGPTLMMEDLRGWSAIKRSVSLVKGTWWSVFGTVLLAWLLFAIVLGVLNFVITLLVGLAFASSDVGPHAFVIGLFEQILSIIFFLPLLESVATVLAVDMRVRKEGLDLDLLSDTLDGATPSYDFLPKPRMVVVPGQAPPPWPPPPPTPSAPSPPAPPPPEPPAGTWPPAH